MMMKLLDQYVENHTVVPFSQEVKDIKEIVSCVEHLPYAINPTFDMKHVLFKAESAIVSLNHDKVSTLNEVLDYIIVVKNSKDICVAYEVNQQPYVYTFPINSRDSKIRHMGRRDTVKFLFNKLIEKYEKETVKPT